MIPRLAIAIACLLATWPGSISPAQPIKTIVSEVGLDQHLGRQLPLDVSLIDERGLPVTLGELIHDRTTILVFVYYRCPMLCGEVLNGVLRSVNALDLKLGTDYQIVAISIDPREPPELAAEKRARYAAKLRHGSADAWHFLTADQAAVDQLTSTAGFRYRYDPASDQFAHASGILVITPRGQIARYLYGVDYPTRQLRLALVESGNGKVGSPVDQLLLLCFHYDPVTGRYGLAISNLLRLAGLLTLLVLGVYLIRMFALERRRAKNLRLAGPELR
jgi:protein SCO1/2